VSSEDTDAVAAPADTDPIAAPADPTVGGDHGGVVVDVRALQAHDHASRGIGRYTVELILELERLDPTLVRAYVTDPLYPTHEQVLRLLATGKLRRSDDPEFVARPPRVLHVTSPFVEGVTDTPLLPAWANRPGTAVVATVYDLIPARYPEIYLRDPEVASRYRNTAQFLRTCDLLLSISDATAADLTELLGVGEQRVLTVHGAAGEEFTPGTVPRATLVEQLAPILPEHTGPDGYVLCPTGAEWRKNLDRLLQAWALVAAPVRRRYPLVVQCHLQPDAREHLEGRAVELGIGQDVRFTGGVPNPVLVDLLRAAALVVFPSIYEGLGLPILEARACGTPVVCGDNSSLRELVEDPSARFDAEDVADIARVIQTHLEDPAALAALAAAPVPERYRWSSVAAAVAAAFRELLRAPLPARPRRPPRIAIASPMPPQMSGPSTYFAEFVRYLPDLCDLTVFTTGVPREMELPREVRIEPIAALELIEAVEGPFDEVLYFIGNSQFHIEEEHQLRRRPGAVFLHDARLTILYSEMYRLRPEYMAGTFGEALHRMYPGRYPAAMGGAQFLPMPEESLFGVLMIADVAAHATRLFVHSEHAADLIELDCGRRPEALFPIPSPVMDASLLRQLDEPQGRPLVSSFGFVSPAKRSEVVLAAMADVPGAELALVGHSGSEFLDALRTEATRQGMGDRVTVTGKITDGEYRDWLLRTTVAVQLRLFSNGESSASVAETLAAGVPTVVTDIGTFAEYPDDVVVKVPRDISTERLGVVLADLVADEDRRRELSTAGRAYAEGNSYRIAAEKLVAELVRPRPPVRQGSRKSGPGAPTC